MGGEDQGQPGQVQEEEESKSATSQVALGGVSLLRCPKLRRPGHLGYPEGVQPRKGPLVAFVTRFIGPFFSYLREKK